MNTHETCNALRACSPKNHEELMTLAAVFAEMVDGANILQNKAKVIVLDYLDSEITGAIKQDKIDQESEQAWNENQGRHVSGFGGVPAELDALTVWKQAA